MHNCYFEEISNGSTIYWHHKKRKYSDMGKHFQDFYEVTLILEGNAINIINDRKYEIKENDLIFVSKNIVHEMALGNNSSTLKYINIAFDREIFDKILNIFSKFQYKDDYAKVSLSKQKAELLTNQYLNINLTSSLKEIGLEIELFLYHLLKEFVIENNNQDKKFPRWLQDIFVSFEEISTLQVGVEYIYRNTPYSPQYTIKQFKKYINMTPTEFVNNCRVEYAKQLLKSTELKIIDIVFECGYDNIEYFYKNFKKFSGYTPKRYRDKINEIIK